MMQYNRKERKKHLGTVHGNFIETGEYRIPKRNEFGLYEDGPHEMVIRASFDFDTTKLKILKRIDCF